MTNESSAARRKNKPASGMIRNVGSNWVLNALRVLVLMHLTPFTIDELGQDVNGVWVAIVSLTGFLKLLILGVPMASVRFLARALAAEDDQQANAAVSTCLWLCVLLGAAAAVVGSALYFAFDGLLLGNARWESLGPDVLATARLAYLLVVAQIAFGFALRLPYGIFDAHQDFVTRNIVMAGELVLRYGLTLLLLTWRASLVSMAIIQIACMLAEFVALILLIRRRHPHIRFGMGAFDRAQLRPIIGFSVFTLVLNAGTMLAFRSDALVIGSVLDAVAVTRFDVANKFFEPLTELVIGIGVVVMPLAARMSATSERAVLSDVFLRWSKVAFSVVLSAGIYLIVLGPEFLAWWLGEEYHPSSGPVLQVLMLSFLAYLPVRGVALPVLLGLGQAARPALGLLCMGLVNLVISIALVKPLGIFGVALGTAIPNVLFAAFLARLACAELGQGTLAYARYVFGRALVGALAPVGFLLAMKLGVGVHGLPQLLLAGLGSVAIFVPVWVFFVHAGDPHLDLLARWRARRAEAAP
jgi:O-antigen/teichoic acid export membrane protein